MHGSVAEFRDGVFQSVVNHRTCDLSCVEFVHKQFKNNLLSLLKYRENVTILVSRA